MKEPDFFPRLIGKNVAQEAYGRACRLQAWNECSMGGDAARAKWVRLKSNAFLDNSDAAYWISAYHAVICDTPRFPAIDGDSPEEIRDASECRARLWRRLVAEQSAPPYREFMTRKSPKFWIGACKKFIKSNLGLV